MGATPPNILDRRLCPNSVCFRVRLYGPQFRRFAHLSQANGLDGIRTRASKDLPTDLRDLGGYARHEGIPGIGLCRAKRYFRVERKDRPTEHRRLRVMWAACPGTRPRVSPAHGSGGSVNRRLPPSLRSEYIRVERMADPCIAYVMRMTYSGLAHAPRLHDADQASQSLVSSPFPAYGLLPKANGRESNPAPREGQSRQTNHRTNRRKEDRTAGKRYETGRGNLADHLRAHLG